MTDETASNAGHFSEVPVADGGTPADQWLPWLRGLPLLHLGDCPGLVVVAPHPDDETLGFGGTALAAAARGVAVRTVIVSDGGAAWPGLSAHERTRLERSRRRESRSAAALLGLPQPLFLGLPDGDLPAQESRLIDILSGILEDGPPGTWCAATWRGDGHPDHEAVGRAAAVAASRTGAVLMEYPVWMWHWARPGEPGVPWDHAYRTVLDPTAAEHKRQAAAAFRTQLESGGPGRDPILPAHVVARLHDVGELVFR